MKPSPSLKISPGSTARRFTKLRALATFAILSRISASPANCSDTSRVLIFAKACAAPWTGTARLSEVSRAADSYHGEAVLAPADPPPPPCSPCNEPLGLHHLRYGV